MRAPTLAVTATIVLALGVGANTVVFTVLNELLLRPIPVEDPSSLVDVWADIEGGNSFLGAGAADRPPPRPRWRRWGEASRRRAGMLGAASGHPEPPPDSAVPKVKWCDSGA